MAIRFSCPQCATVLHAQDEWKGRKANCKKCGNRLIVPDESIAAEAIVIVDDVKNYPTTRPAIAKSIPTSKTEPHEDPTATDTVEAVLKPVEANPETTRQISNASDRPAKQKPSETRAVSKPRVVATNSNNLPSLGSQVPATASFAQTEHVRLTPQAVADAFTDTIERPKVNWRYQLSLLAVSVFMLVLPLIYLCLVASVAAAGVAYGYYGTRIFDTPTRGRGGLGLMLAYFGPLVAAAIVVIFMIKPFFARPPRSTKPRSLTRATEPILFDFVDKLCDVVNAPIPKRIDVDADVNASASYRRGWLSILQANDLVLTIGMPLVHGLTARELAGVLAHEFGHFSQGLGMRLTYIVRSINLWFARVVYQRDRADEWLQNTAKQLDIRFSLVLYFAMAMVWLTRRILWLFMMAGNAVSCLLLRQMEFDADQYEIQLAGSKSFVSTAKQLRRLGLAYQQSIGELQEFFVDGKLVDDLPLLVRINRDAQTAETIAELEKEQANEKGNWYDTHPSDQARMEVAHQMNSPGKLRLDAPASSLLCNFEALSKDVSKDFFSEIFEGEFREEMLASVEQLTRFKRSAQEAHDARSRLFGENFSNLRMMNLRAMQDEQWDSSQAITALGSFQQRMQQMHSAYVSDSKQFDESDNRWIKCQQAISLLQCGMKLEPRDWEGLPVQSLDQVFEALRLTEQQLGVLHERLWSYEKSFENRLHGAMQWLFANTRSGASSEWSELLAQSKSVLQCLATQDQVYRQILDLRNDFTAVCTIFAATNNGDNLNEKHVKQIELHGARIKQIIAGIQQIFTSVPYPFQHAKGQIDMAHYLLPNAQPEMDLPVALDSADSLLRHYQYAYFRNIGTLATVVEKVEKAAGL